MLQLSEGIRLMAQDVSADYLTDALIAAVDHSKIELHFQKGLAGGADTAIAAESQRANCNCRLDCRCLAKAAEPASTPAPAGASANCKNACLAKGETLTQISKQHGVSVEDIQQLEQDRGCQETAGMPNDQNPLYDSAAGSGRVVGAPSHGPESAHKSDDDLLSNAKIVNIRYARKEAKTKTTNSSSMGA